MYADVVLGVDARSASRRARRGARRDAAASARHRRVAPQRRGAPAQGPRLGARRGGARDARREQKEHRRRRRPASPSPTIRYEQLWGAIGAVFRSWNNRRAKVYRKMHDIPESWGTACNVQAMVFGNLGDDSGTGVAFTRDPSTGERRFFGEWLPNAQGEDVVAGIRTPHPVSQGRRRRRDTRSRRRCPSVYARARRDVYQKLEKHFRDMQDLEFTDPGGQALHAAVPHRQAHRAAPRCASPSRWCKEGLITSARRSSASTRRRSTSSCTRARSRSAPKKLLARGLPGEPRRGERPGRLHRRRGRAPRRAGRGRDPRARRDVARGHPRHEGGARHPHRARRHDEPRRRRRARHGQALRRGLLGGQRRATSSRR